MGYKLEKQGRTCRKLSEVLSERKRHGNTENKAGGSIKLNDNGRAAALWRKSNEGVQGSDQQHRGKFRTSEATRGNKEHSKRGKTVARVTMIVQCGFMDGTQGANTKVKAPLYFEN